MIKYLIGALFITVLATGCRKVDDSSVFGQSPDQRLNEKMAAYQSQLSGAQYGWKAALTTGAGGLYTLYFKFNDSNRVRMLSSFDSTSAVTLKESSYRLKALQQPSLIFDTYSYIHVLADPNPASNGGTAGAGLVSDFEFMFDDSTTSADQVGLRGRFNGSKMILTRATQAEATAFNSGQLAAGLNINKILTYYKRIVIGGTDSADIHIDASTNIVAAIDAQGNLLDESKKSAYSLMLGGLSFVKPIPVGTKSISGISDIVYNTTTNVINATVNGSPAVIKQVLAPAKFDTAAPRRWWEWARRSIYVGSSNGFHQNGVDDALGLKSLAGFSYVEYRPVAQAPYDAVRIIGSTAYGPAITPNFNTSGRVIFPNSGLQFGTPPAAATAKYLAFRNQLFQAQGYYAVQTASGSDETITYDLVSVADAKTWISWTY